MHMCVHELRGYSKLSTRTAKRTTARHSYEKQFLVVSPCCSRKNTLLYAIYSCIKFILAVPWFTTVLSTLSLASVEHNVIILFSQPCIPCTWRRKNKRLRRGKLDRMVIAPSFFERRMWHHLRTWACSHPFSISSSIGASRYLISRFR